MDTLTAIHYARTAKTPHLRERCRAILREKLNRTGPELESAIERYIIAHDSNNIATLNRLWCDSVPAVAMRAQLNLQRRLKVLGSAELAQKLPVYPKVDEEAGTIYNVAAMTVGPAKGHGFTIDEISLAQTLSLALQYPKGVPMRWKHPPVINGIESDSLGTEVGFFCNPRMLGGARPSLRGDVYLADYSSCLPGIGNVRTYLLKRAQNDPTGFGLSAVIRFDVEPVFNTDGQVTALAARISELSTIDFVGTPAANPNGLLGAKFYIPKQEYSYA